MQFLLYFEDTDRASSPTSKVQSRSAGYMQILLYLRGHRPSKLAHLESTVASCSLYANRMIFNRKKGFALRSFC